MLFEPLISDINDFMKVGTIKNRRFRYRIYSFRNWWIFKVFKDFL